VLVRDTIGIRSCPCLLFLSLALFLSCSKKDSDTTSSTSSSPATTTSSPSTTQSTEDDGAHPLREMVDPRLHPAVYLTVNSRSTIDLPQGWPLIVNASIFGGRDEPITIAPDDVALTVTDAKGAPMGWPIKRAPYPASTRPATTVSLMANDKSAAHLAWVLADSIAIPVGAYHLSATLKGATPHNVDFKIVAPIAQPDEDLQTDRFIAQCRAALALGDSQTALSQADERLKTKPTDLPALHVRADALAALGKTDDAIAAYSRALDQFYAQNPNAPEPPTILLRSLRQLTGGN
jgi:hypothetical protein